MICNLGVVGSNPTRGSKELKFEMGSYQSGQMGLTVTQLSFDFGGSNPSLPTTISKAIKIAEVAKLIEH